MCARALPGWEKKLPLLHSHLLRSRGSQLKAVRPSLRFAADNRCAMLSRGAVCVRSCLDGVVDVRMDRTSLVKSATANYQLDPSRVKIRVAAKVDVASETVRIHPRRALPKKTCVAKFYFYSLI